MNHSQHSITSPSQSVLHTSGVSSVSSDPLTPPSVASAFNNLQNRSSAAAPVVPSCQTQVQHMWGVPLARDDEELTTEQDMTDDESDAGGVFTDLAQQGMRLFTNQIGEGVRKAFEVENNDKEEALYEAIPETDASEVSINIVLNLTMVKLCAKSIPCNSFLFRSNWTFINSVFFQSVL